MDCACKPATHFSTALEEPWWMKYYLSNMGLKWSMKPSCKVSGGGGSPSLLSPLQQQIPHGNASPQDLIVWSFCEAVAKQASNGTCIHVQNPLTVDCQTPTPRAPKPKHSWRMGMNGGLTQSGWMADEHGVDERVNTRETGGEYYREREGVIGLCVCLSVWVLYLSIILSFCVDDVAV